MVGSTRIDLASNRLEGSAFAASYPNGQRSTYSSPSLERSASFRDSLESRLMVSGSVAYRNTSHSSEIPPPSQFLSLEPFSIAELNLKYSRQGELRRALALSVEDHSIGSVQSKNLPPIASEELKRFKVSVLDTCIRARERSKLMQEAIQKLDKYRGIVTRRRQRNEAQSVEKPGSSNMLKTSNLIHQNSLDATNARTEERSKSAIPNKRVRSSIVESRFEGRSTMSARQGAVMDKDKNVLLEKEKSMLRACTGGPISSEERSHALHAGGDGWEKKLKRKRSVSTMVTRTLDDREFKQTMQQKPTTETRTRASDGLGFRSGPSNGTIGSSRIENSSQISGNSCRAMPRNETENISLSSESRERVAGLDKEKMMAKGSSKLNSREDCQLGSQSLLVKGKASRASRNGVGSLTSASNLLHLSGGMEGWEQSHCLNKGQQFSALANCKRPLTTGSLSAPVAQWVGQRPQKISRTRRANVVSPVSNFDDVQVLPEALSVPDVGARLSSVDSGGSLNSRVVSNGPYQLKIRLDNVSSPAGLSESEESGVIENKRVKGLDNDEADNCFPPKLFASPMKKNKIPPKEEIGGDGVRRHGRSGRISANLKASLVITKEKPENVDTTKQFKSSRPASDKVGLAVLRQRSCLIARLMAVLCKSIRGVSLDLIGETDDDHEELMTAAIAARNFSYNACSTSFWKKMEIVFAFISPEDLNFVKNQIKFAEEIDYSLCSILEPEHYAKV
ncbi:hypothetical protein HPP92_009873 [Vanilla planifolia]|uniref:Uncharacterized protein n=1 Tax=Vanilla planifolia TaxID=51239 RepID=A0A835R7D3_VANPL|nr:hypothetical protein HPP92_009873 [Vanilla planifolia]